jgi:zinc protease
MTVSWAGLSPVRTVLANGVTVITKETRVTPAVTIHAAVHAGSTADPPDVPGLAYFLSRMIDRGTTSMGADAIAEALDSRGVSLATSVNRHALSLVSTCLIEDFTSVLGIMADCLMQPAFAEQEIVTRRGEMITFIRQDEDNPAAVAMTGLMELLYGADHPYGRRIRGTVEGAERISRAHLVDFHRKIVVPASIVIAIVGDIESAAAADACAEALGRWPALSGVDGTGGAKAHLALTAPEPIDSRRMRVMPMMNKAQADIAYGFTSIRRSDPRYYAYALMNNVLGEYSIGGRLGDSIRERQGMAYYVLSSLDANVIPGPLAIRAGVASTNVDRTIAAIDHEVSRLATDGPTDQELTESKQYLIGSLPRTLETNMSIAEFLQTVEFFDLGLDYDVRLPSLLQAVTRDEAHEAARRVLDPDRAAVVVAGPYVGTTE